MRIAFFMRNVGYIRNFEWVVRKLAKNGHSVLIYFDHEKKAVDRMQESSDKVAEEHMAILQADHPKVKYANLRGAFSKPRTIYTVAARRIRLILDYVRYLDPEFTDAHKLRERAAIFLRPRVRRRVDFFGRWRWSKSAMIWVLATLDGLIPPRRDVVEFLRNARPKLVMVTPLFGHGSSQVDYFKACSHLGIRSSLPVASWDNLTSKGAVQCRPGSILVWNEAQKDEAVKLQRMPAANVHVTGAHSYEHWFNWEPSTDKAAFIQKAGLDPDQNYIVYLGSSRFIAEQEVPVTLKWARAIRESDDPVLSKIGILIRPHPQNYGDWMEVDLTDIGNAVIYPRGGANPVGRAAKSEYFDTMYHCKAIVGVNTSGMIEAAILGKAVHTVLFEEMAETQEGTLHFRHLAGEESGLLRVARNFDEHRTMLARSIVDPTEDERRNKAFVDHFVWPSSLGDTSPVDEFTRLVTEQLQGPAPSRGRVWLPLVWIGRVLAAPLLLLYLREHRDRMARGKERRRRIEAAKAAMQ